MLDGEVDAAVVGGRAAVLTDGEIEGPLGLMLQSANREAQIGASGVTLTPLEMQSVGADTRYEGTRKTIATVIVFLLFFMIIGTVMMVAMGVVEEKSSRIVEILLISIRPWQLLGGKVLGLGVIGFINLVALLAAGLVGAYLSGFAADFPPGIGTVVISAVVWWILGYAFSPCSPGRSRRWCRRQEDMNSAVNPLIMLIMIVVLRLVLRHRQL